MRLITLIILCLSFFSALSQKTELNSVWDKSSVHKIEVDHSSAEIYFRSDKNTYVYDGQRIHNDDHEIPEDFSSIEIDANVLRYKDQKLIAPASILSAEMAGDSSIYFTTDIGLFYSRIPMDVIAQKVDYPEINLMGSIDRVFVEHSYLILSNSTSLCFWDRTTEEVSCIENSYGSFHDVQIDNYGVLWLASDKGLFNYPLSPLLLKTLPKLKVELDGKHDLEIDQEIKITSADELHFNLRGIHPYLGEEIELYAMLDDERRIIEDGHYTLSGLSEGKHSLYFLSKLKNAKESQFSQEFKVEVKNKTFNYWWLIFGAVGLLLAMSLLGNFRNQQATKDLESQRDKLLLENKALKAEQQALRLQMNPHFIFNVLNSINGMIATGASSDARFTINQFSQLMRSVLEQSRSEFITLEKELKYLREYLSLEQIIRNDSFDYIIDVDEQLDPEMETFPMIMQPFIENAIIHGFKNMNREAYIYIDLTSGGDHLRVTIRDNGVGRVASSKAKTSEHNSVAMKVVLERLRAPYAYEVVDLYDDDNNPSGTVISINMPLRG
jgi:hypothetical protein